MTHIRVFDLYGILERNMEQVASALTQAIGARFQRHSSDSWGDFYSFHRTDYIERLNLKENYNTIEGELTWPEYARYPLILEVTVESPARAREIESAVLLALGRKATLLERDKRQKD